MADKNMEQVMEKAQKELQRLQEQSLLHQMKRQKIILQEQ